MERYVLTFLLACLLNSSLAFGQAQEIKVGTPLFFPLAWRENGQVIGRVPAYIDTLLQAHDTPVKVEYVPCTMVRCVALLEQGKIDLLFSLPVLGLQMSAISLGKVIPLTIEVWLSKDRKLSYESDQLPSIVATRSLYAMVELKNYRVSIVDSPLRFFPMYQKERVDGIAGQVFVLSSIAAVNGFEESRFVKESIAELPVYLWTNPTSIIFQDLNYWNNLVTASYTEDRIALLEEEVVELIAAKMIEFRDR